MRSLVLRQGESGGKWGRFGRTLRISRTGGGSPWRKSGVHPLTVALLLEDGWRSKGNSGGNAFVWATATGLSSLQISHALTAEQIKPLVRRTSSSLKSRIRMRNPGWQRYSEVRRQAIHQGPCWPLACAIFSELHSTDIGALFFLYCDLPEHQPVQGWIIGFPSPFKEWQPARCILPIRKEANHVDNPLHKITSRSRRTRCSRLRNGAGWRVLVRRLARRGTGLL